jgi:hypothetical protein
MQQIQLSELELTLLSSFNLYLFIDGDKSKEESEECFKTIVEAIREDTPLYFYAKIVLSIINGTFNSEVTDALLNEDNRNSEGFRAFEKLLIDRNTGLKNDTFILNGVYELLMQYAHHLTNGNVAQVSEAVDNIEALQKILSERTEQWLK